MRRFIENIYRVLIPATISVVVLSLLGLIRDVTMFRSSTGLLRHSLGFSHPNVLGVIVFQIVICYVILHDGMILKQLIVTGVGALFDYLIPNSQSPTFLLGLLFFILPMYHFISKRENGSFLFCRFLIIGATICNVLCVFVTVMDFSRYPFFSKLNGLISSRFLYARRAYLESGVKLFGQVVYTLEEDRRLVGLHGHLYLDTAYATLLIRYGLIVYAIFSIAYLAMMRMQTKKRRDLVVIILFIFAVYGIMESSMFMLKYNFLLLYLSELLYSSDYSFNENRIESYQLE